MQMIQSSDLKLTLALSKKLLSGTMAYIVLTTPISDDQLKFISTNKSAYEICS